MQLNIDDGRPADKHRNIATETWAAMIAQGFSTDSSPYPPENWAVNRKGQPICVVIVWDPNTKTTIDAFLQHKAQEARWREGDTIIPDLRMLLIPQDADRGQACQSYALESCVRAWAKGELCIGDQTSDAEHRTRPSTLSGDEPPPRPLYMCSAVNPETGFFGIMGSPFERYLEHPATSGQALEFAKRIQLEYQSKESVRWPKTESRMDVHDLEVDKENIPSLNLEAPTSFEEVETKYGPWVLDTVASDGKIRIVINADSRAFGIALDSVTLLKDTMALLPGGGGFRPQDEADKCKKDGYFTLRPEIKSDNVSFWYKKKGDKLPQMYTFYSLKAQFALDGFPDVPLVGHQITKKETPGTGGAQRFTVEPLPGNKTWCTNARKRKAAEAGIEGADPNNPTWQTALAYLHDHANLPNMMVKIVWNVDLQTEPSPLIRFRQPGLCWSQTMALTEGQIFQWA